MPDGHTWVRDVGGVGGTEVRIQGGDVPQAAEKTDALPVLQSITYNRLDGCAQTVYAWDGNRN